MKIWKAILSGPPFRSNLNRIIIDLNHFCDLSCIDCNRSCGRNQAPAMEIISVVQIRRFINESIITEKNWDKISLEGGEPTLHPDLNEIIHILLQYKLKYSKQCEIKICTNGYSEKAKQLLSNPPAGILVKSSGKSLLNNNGHIPFNIAPKDLPEYSMADFSHGCYIHYLYGLGLNRNGYYAHPICGSIDRIFGFDIGLKKIPNSPDEIGEQMSHLCSLCGHFRQYFRNNRHKLIATGKKSENDLKGSCSVSWEDAYSAYKSSRPELTLY